MFVESKVESKVCVNKNSIDKQELGLYLGLNRTPAELEALGLRRFCQKRLKHKGKPVITGCAQEEDLSKRYKPWRIPEE